MPIYDKVVKDININFKDVFHLKNLYKVIHDWIIQEGFGPDKDMEVLYYQWDKQTAGTEHWIWWRTERESGDKYLKYRIDVDMHTLGITKAEVVVGGHKMKTNTGEVDVHITGYMVYDYEDKWKKSKFLSMFHDFYRKRIKKETYTDLEENFIFDVYRLHAHIKQYLELAQIHPYDYPKGFQPIKGL